MKFKPWHFVLGWLLYDFIDNGIYRFDSATKNAYVNLFSDAEGAMVFTSSKVCFFAFSLMAYVVMYKFFARRKWFGVVIGLLVALTLPIALRYGIEEVMYDRLFGFTNYYPGTSVLYYVTDNLHFATKNVVFGCIWFVVRWSFHRLKLERKLTVENQRMELNLLRSQINPHFLLNGINNIYSLVFQKSERALPALDHLSGILRYTLYENRERVTLREELKIVNELVELNRIRYDYPVHVNIEVKNVNEETPLPPFLLFPLVENAFKHGDLSDAAQPLRFTVNGAEGQLQFVVTNRKRSGPRDGQGGIGLENIRKRLQLLFPDQHRFEVTDGADTFEVKIEIDRP